MGIHFHTLQMPDGTTEKIDAGSMSLSLVGFIHADGLQRSIWRLSRPLIARIADAASLGRCSAGMGAACSKRRMMFCGCRSPRIRRRKRGYRHITREAARVNPTSNPA